MTRLWLMRHPAPGGPKGLCYGRSCPGLAPGWEAAVDAARAALPPLVRLIASPAPRCAVPARWIGTALGLEVAEDARLRELDFGRWEGMLWSRIDRRESDPWAEDPVNRAPPGGERFADLAARVAEAVATLAEAPGPILIVTHAGPIRALWMAREGMSFAAAFARPVPFAVPMALGGPSTAPG